MAIYTPFQWVDEEVSRTTPINAKNLNDREVGIYEASVDANKALSQMMQGGITVSTSPPLNKPDGHLWVDKTDAELYTLKINNGQTGDVYVPVMMTPTPRVDYVFAQNVPAGSGVQDMSPDISHGTFPYPTRLIAIASWSYGASTADHLIDLDITDDSGNTMNVGPRTAGATHITVHVPAGSDNYSEWTMHCSKTFAANTDVKFKGRYNNYVGGNAYLRLGVTSWVYPDKG